MPPRPQKFNAIHEMEMLKTIGDCRAKVLTLSVYALNSDKALYGKINEITKAIDDIAEHLTGDRSHFHGKALSSTMHMSPKQQG